MGSEGYLLSNILLQTIAKYGLVAGALILVLFVCVALAAHFLKKRIDLMYQQELNREQERARESQFREQERGALIGHLNQERDKLHIFMTNHLAHDREEREALTKVLTEISVKDQATVDALREVAGSLRDHRDEEAKRTATIHDRLNQIHLDVRDK